MRASRFPFNLTFVHAVLAGTASAEEVDDWIDRWHDSPCGEDGNQAIVDGYHCELHEYLGMPWGEYAEWVAHPESILKLIHTIELAKAEKEGTSMSNESEVFKEWAVLKNLPVNDNHRMAFEMAGVKLPKSPMMGDVCRELKSMLAKIEAKAPEALTAAASAQASLAKQMESERDAARKELREQRDRAAGSVKICEAIDLLVNRFLRRDDE